MPTFALSPFLATATAQQPDILDYTSKSGREHYRVATEPLDTEGLDLNPNDALTLLDLFAERASSMGWDRENGPLKIPDGTGTKRDLVSQYALPSDKNVTDSELKLMGVESRDSQDSYMIFQCLYRSMTRSAKSALSLRSDN